MKALNQAIGLFSARLEREDDFLAGKTVSHGEGILQTQLFAMK